MTLNLHPAHIGGRYILLEMLGAGGMGEVYRALDPLTRQVVALKRLTTNPLQLQSNATALSHATTLSYTPRIAITHEFRTLAGLRHPNIITVLDYGFDWGGPFFIMEWVESPRQLTQAGLLLPLVGQVRLLADTLRALSYLHRRGIIHRDLKPANALVTPSGQLKLLDFGIALTTQEAKRRPNAIGTLAYLAPEVLANAAPSFQSDLYALGVMAYEMFTGRHPFDITDRTRLMAEALTVEPDFSLIPEAMRPFVTCLMSKSPDGRYTSAESALAALAKVSGVSLPPEDDALRESLLQAASFVGREAEFAALHKSLDKLFRLKRGAVWLIAGESGMGKSRLADELAVHALAGGALTLRAQAFEALGLPYQLWRDSIRPLLLYTRLDDSEAAILKDIVPDIGLLLERDIPDPPPAADKEYDSRMTGVLTALISRQTTPVVLIFEDIQWTMESLKVLQEILPLAETQALFIVGTYQPSLRPSLPKELPTAKVLPLTPMTPDGIRSLTRAIIGFESESLTRLLLEETGGNVFLSIETVRALAEHYGGLSALRAAAPTLSSLPVTASQVIQHRLSQLPDAMRPLLQLAAVTGRMINFNYLRAALKQNPTLLSPEWSLERWLNTGAAHAVLEVSNQVWRFRHDQLRQAILDGLETQTLQELHRLAAHAWQSLEAELGEDALLDTLSYHWRMAKDIDQSLNIGMKLAARLSYRGWRDEARILLDQLVEQVSTEISPRRVELLSHLGDTLLADQQVVQALRYYDEAAQLAHQLNQPPLLARTAYAQARAYLRLGRLDDAHRAAETCRTINHKLDNPVGLSSAMTMLGMIADKRGDVARARDAHALAVSYARQANHPYRLCVALANFGSITLDAGDTVRARDILTEGLRLAYAEGIEQFQAVMNLALAQVYSEEARPITALDHLNHALGLAQQLGGRELLVEILGSFALTHLWRGDDDSAGYYAQQALALDPRDVIARLVQMHIALVHGGAAIAVSDSRAVVLDAQRSGDTMILSCAVMQVACVRLHLGASKEAERLFMAVQGITQARQLSRRWYRFLSPHFVQTAPLSDPFAPPLPDHGALERLTTAVNVLLRIGSPP